MIRLATGKFHSRFSFCRNTVTECRTIAPSSHRTQNVAILRGSVAAQNEWTLDATIHPDDETDGNCRMHTGNIKQGIGGSKCLRLATVLNRPKRLLYGTPHGRKYVIGIAANQTDGTDNDHQNYRQHNGVFGNILTLLVLPQAAKETIHDSPLLRTAMAFRPTVRGS